MINPEIIKTCKACSFSGIGNYCSECGEAYDTKRISLPGLMHDIFHFFTHLEKGFGYTMKQLIISPGHMQREYIEGNRSKHQKPFSMFFICATIAALSRYWIFKILLKYYDAGNISEATYFHEYMVLLQIALLPLHILLIFIFFYKSKYNYAEIGIMFLYTASFLYVMSVIISSLRFIWPHLDTAFIELPVFLIYNALTFMNFFRGIPRWIVALKSTIILSIVFLLLQLVEDFVIGIIT